MESHGQVGEGATDSLYGRSFAEIEYMAEVYRKYGKHDLADELYSLLGRETPAEFSSAGEESGGRGA